MPTKPLKKSGKTQKRNPKAKPGTLQRKIPGRKTGVVPGKNTLSIIRQKVIPKNVSDYSSPVAKQFFSILRKEMTRLQLRGKKPFDFRHTIFVSSVVEMISLLPKTDTYRRHLESQLRKNNNYQIPADTCEVALRSAYLNPKQKGGKKVSVQYVFVGNKISVEERAGVFKVITRKMVDSGFKERITARTADNKLNGVFFR